jgi:hypothetical protein
MVLFSFCPFHFMKGQKDGTSCPQEPPPQHGKETNVCLFSNNALDHLFVLLGDLSNFHLNVINVQPFFKTQQFCYKRCRVKTMAVLLHMMTLHYFSPLVFMNPLILQSCVTWVSTQWYACLSLSITHSAIFRSNMTLKFFVGGDGPHANATYFRFS